MDAFDHAYESKEIMEKTYNKPIPMRIFTDSKYLFDVIEKESKTSEKRLAIHLKAVNESYRHMEIFDIGFIH